MRIVPGLYPFTLHLLSYIEKRQLSFYHISAYLGKDKMECMYIREDHQAVPKD